MGSEAAKEVGPQHRGDHGPETAARLPLDAPVPGIIEGPVAVVNERHDVVAQVAVVKARAGRVNELRTPVCGPGIDIDHQARRRLAAGEEFVGGLWEREPVGTAVRPHRYLACVALEHVYRRVPPGRLIVIARRHVNPQRAISWIPKCVAGKGPRRHDVAIDPPNQFLLPWHRHP